MLEFEVEEAPATLENLNTRTEKNGQDTVPACDLKISMVRDAGVLAFFEPTLKAFYFNDKGPRDLADGLPLRDPHAVYPHARDEQMSGATVKIGYGVGEPMTFKDVKIDSFKLTPMEGGSVIVGCRVQCKPDAFKELPNLYLLQQKGITLSIEPCELPEMQNAA